MNTLADHAEWLAEHTDRIAKAVRTGNPQLVAHICAQVSAHQPPHGVDPAHALLVVMAAQIDTRVPMEQRLAWLLQQDTSAQDDCKVTYEEGYRGPCNGCQRPMATKRTYRKHGMLRYEGNGRCNSCARNERREERPDPKRRSQAQAKPPSEFLPPAPFKGRCRDEPDTFFPEPGDRVALERARKICQACPYKAPCLTRALQVDEPFGVFAGTTPQQRSRMSLPVLMGEAA